MKQLLTILAALLSIVACTNNVKVGDTTVNNYTCQRAVDSAKVKIKNITEWKTGDFLFCEKGEYRIVNIDICNSVVIIKPKIGVKGIFFSSPVYGEENAYPLGDFSNCYNKTAAERAGTLK